MATTGFWPIKGSLKEVIEYARNPDKTTDTQYIDDDLSKALQYVRDDNKTDKQIYVSAINCHPKRAYAQMTATKKRYGKTGGNVAYHGYQSFQTGEVTPQEAHHIGMETARKMWGDEYEIVVTTHLNTDNLHNHIVVNSVSFKTGKKFENHISDHYKLREISDAICKEHGKSVLENAPFYRQSKGAYWMAKNGKLTHRDILKQDIERCLQAVTNAQEFKNRLRDLGYTFTREGKTLSVKAPDWQRAIRLSSLGYDIETINKRMEQNHNKAISEYRYNTYRKPKQYKPLLLLEIEMAKIHRMNGMQVAFALVIELCKLLTGNNVDKSKPRPLSPTMRAEVRHLDQIQNEYKLLCENQIDSAEELVLFMEQLETKITTLAEARSTQYNQVRRAKSDSDKEDHKATAKEITEQITPLRKQLKVAQAALERTPHCQALLETERSMERAATKEKGFDR